MLQILEVAADTCSQRCESSSTRIVAIPGWLALTCAVEPLPYSPPLACSSERDALLSTYFDIRQPTPARVSPLTVGLAHLHKQQQLLF